MIRRCLRVIGAAELYRSEASAQDCYTNAREKTRKLQLSRENVPLGESHTYLAQIPIGKVPVRTIKFTAAVGVRLDSGAKSARFAIANMVTKCLVRLLLLSSFLTTRRIS